MEKLEVELLNPNAKQLLLELQSLNLITIKDKNEAIMKFLDSFKNMPECDLTMEEITEEVEIVRAERYARSQAQAQA